MEVVRNAEVVESKEIALGAGMQDCTVGKKWNRVRAQRSRKSGGGQDGGESRQHGDG